MFNINLESFNKMDPKEREKVLYDKIYGKVQESLKILEKRRDEDNPRNSEKRTDQPNNHF